MPQSKAEKIFWTTIVVFFVIYLTIHFIGIERLSAKYKKEIKQPLLEATVAYLPTDDVAKNLDKNQNIINKNLNQQIDILNATVDKEVDRLFKQVENNVESFLDFHYSVKGEYLELGAMLSNSLEEKIQEKIFGKDFTKKYDIAMQNIAQKYKLSIDNHSTFVENIGLENIDLKHNAAALERMKEDIKRFQYNIATKISLAGVGAGAQLAVLLSSKIALKAGSKVTGKAVVKGGAKLAAKEAAAATAAAAGTLCGPFVWVCSPTAAAIAWVSTDVIVVSADEKLNRDKLKQEILDSLDQDKKRLKQELKANIFKNLKKLSEDVQIKLKKTPLEKRKKTLYEQIQGS